MDTKNNDVKISKIVSVDLDVNMTDSTTVSRILEPIFMLRDPDDCEKYTLIEMARTLIGGTKVTWNAIDESYYLLKLKKRKFKDESFTGYECTLYPGEIRDRRIKIVPPQPGLFHRETAKWIIKASSDDVASAFPITVCSECGKSNGLAKTEYCPHCGRMMTNPLIHTK